MGKSDSVHLFILIWTITGCLILGSSAGRGAGLWNRNEPDQESQQKSISCYECNSEYDPNCGEKFNPYTLGTKKCSLDKVPEHLNQSLKATICRKLVMKVYGKIRIWRGCGYIESEYDNHNCVKRSGTHDVQVLHCSCTKTLCNSAHRLRISHYMTFSAIIISALNTMRVKYVA